MVPQGFLGIPQEGKGIPFMGVSEKREGGKGTQSLVRHCLITFRIFVRCQRLITRNVANCFFLNRGASHCYEACCIDDMSRGSFSGYESI